MYTPNNAQVYTSAFAGAVAGMAVSDRVITDGVAASYAGIVAVAGAFAEQFDTVWGVTPALSLEIQTVQEACESAWQNRAPIPDVTNTNPVTWNSQCVAIMALVLESVAYYTANGILNPPFGNDTFKVAATAADTTPDYLAPKLTAGAGITLSLLNPGANEQIQIDATAVTEDHKVSVTAADTTPDFLASKVVAGTSVSLTLLNPGANEMVEISVPFATPNAHASTHLPTTGTDPLTTAIAGTIAVGDVASVGVGNAFSRNDHIHALPAPAAPVNVTKAASDAGTSTTVARSDHKHDVTTAAPAIGIGGGNTDGVAASLSRSDHNHTLRETSGGTDLTIAGITDGQTLQRTGTTIVGIPNDTSCVPPTVVQSIGQGTRALVATFDGGAYFISKRCSVTAISGRLTAGGAGGIISYGIYQVPGGLYGGSATLIASGTFTNVAGGSANYTIAIPSTVVEAGVVYILCGRANAVAVTSRVYSTPTYDVLDANIIGAPLVFTTAISSLVAPPATFDPSVSGTTSIANILPIVRFS